MSMMMMIMTDVQGQGLFSGLRSVAHNLNLFRPHQQSFRPFVETQLSQQGQVSHQQQFRPAQHQQGFNFQPQQTNNPDLESVTSFVHNTQPVFGPSFEQNTFFHPRPVSTIQSQDAPVGELLFPGNTFPQRPRNAGKEGKMV